jgi:hypothetical protein
MFLATYFNHCIEIWKQILKFLLEFLAIEDP